MHKQTARRTSLQYEGLLQSASHQTKLWIETALKKANTAVKHDTLNDFESAIFYYSDVVDLLNKVLKTSKEKKEEMDGLEAICNIYMERIDFLSYLMHTDPEIINEKKEDVSLNNKETFSSKKSSIGDTSTHSNMVAGNPNTQNSSRSPKQEYFNSVFLNMFTKRKTNKKETTHHSHSSSQKHKNLYPKASKSTPTTIPESLWKRQTKSKSHHISSDEDLASIISSLTSTPSGSTDALCLPLKGNKNGHSKSRSCLPLGKGHHNKSSERREVYLNEDQVTPILPRRNCNRNSPSGISCSSSHHSESVETYNNGPFKKNSNNPCLKIPKKSSQRRPNSANNLDYMPIGKHISEPIRDSSLSHVHSWRARNSPSASSSYEFSNTDIPNGLERKAESVASHYPQIVRKGTSVSPLNTVLTCLDPSNMAINSNNDSVFPSSIKIPIPGTAKIDPFITMNYPEAVTINNESLASRDRPQTPLRNGYITDKLYISKEFM